MIPVENEFIVAAKFSDCVTPKSPDPRFGSAVYVGPMPLSSGTKPKGPECVLAGAKLVGTPER